MNNKEFLNDIPANWKKIKLKNLVDTKITDGPHETPELIDEGIPFISAEAIKNNTIDFEKKRGFISKELHKKYSRKCSPKKNDILIIKSGATTGNSSIVETDKIFDIWSPLALVRANEEVIYPKYLFNVINSALFKNQIEISWSFGTQQNIGMGVIENLFIPVPKKNIQKVINRFIDLKTKEIDLLINLLEKQVKLFEEQRQTIITEVVTKGLNSNVKMKDSGVEWIGEIPEHWEIHKLKHVVKNRNDKQKVYANDNYIGLENIKSGYGELVEKEDQFIEGVGVLAEEGDILFGKLRPYLKKVLINNKRAKVSTEILVMNPTKKIRNTFLFYLFLSEKLVDIINSSSYGAKMPRASWNFIGNLPVCLPNIDEQFEIVESIKANENSLIFLISSVKKQIFKLTEYRQSLVYEAVTGEIPIEEMESYLKEAEKDGN